VNPHSAPSRRPVRILANLFSVSFSVAGLALCWSTAAGLIAAPAWPGNVLWIITAALWLITLLGYVRSVVVEGRARSELSDPILAPFTALIFIIPMLCGVALAPYQSGAGQTIFLVGLVGTVLIGGWLSGEWILDDMTLQQWHPGYFLPTVAGGLIAAGGSAVLGYDSLARLMLGFGVICWLLLGSVILVRLFTQPALPTALLPTMAIELAPPVVGGTAWFEINGGRLDTVALVLAGYGGLMVLVQLRLAPAYLRVPFGPGTWAYGFSAAAAFTVGIRWLSVEHVDGQRALTYTLLGIITAGIAALVVRTVIGLVRGTFLPRAAALPQQN
jgi:tellurite resistance protein